MNIGMNRTSTNPISDYVRGITTLGSFADYIVINVSSPNTPGLRQLQYKEHLEQLVSQVRPIFFGKTLLGISP